MTSIYLKGGGRIDKTTLSAERWRRAVLSYDRFIDFQYAGPEGVQDYNPEARKIVLLVDEIAGVKERAE
jgi:hypothetical protein